MSYLLLAAVVLAWGFSWFAITWQVSEAHAFISVAHRFVLASLVMCGGLAVSGRLKRVALRDHAYLGVMGLCLFSLNFISFYIAAIYLPSGLLSVIFATAAIFGALNQWVFFGQRLETRVILATVLGVSGLALLLGPEVFEGDGRPVPWWAVALPFVGTFLFSLGNLASARLSRSYGLPNIVGQGMCYGALTCLMLCLISGQPITFPDSALYWAGAVFLALISSLLAFMAYLTLVNREGVARASYATVLFPILAMFVSSQIEGYVWTWSAAIGLALALGGTVMVFARRSH